jgi:hypothetical protein
MRKDNVLSAQHPLGGYSSVGPAGRSLTKAPRRSRWCPLAWPLSLSVENKQYNLLADRRATARLGSNLFRGTTHSARVNPSPIPPVKTYHTTAGETDPVFQVGGKDSLITGVAPFSGTARDVIGRLRYTRMPAAIFASIAASRSSTVCIPARGRSPAPVYAYSQNWVIARPCPWRIRIRTFADATDYSGRSILQIGNSLPRRLSRAYAR